MEEMIEMLELEGCLLPSDDQIEIDENKIAILKCKIDEDVRQVEVISLLFYKAEDFRRFLYPKLRQI